MSGIPTRPDKRLDGMVAVIVGGGTTGDDDALPGTGAATALLMASEGASLVVVGRSPAHTNATAKRIVDAGGEAIAVLADATADDDCRRMAASAIDEFGRIDVLVNNVGFGISGSVVDIAEADWDRVMAANLKSVVMPSKHVVPEMAESGHGSVINIGSVASTGANLSTAYSTAKAGLVALTQSMALAHGRDGIRVNCILPGHLHTPFAGSASRDGGMREMRRRLSMLGLEGTGWDVGWCAVFLASGEARFLTAACVPVDGGASAELPLSVAQRFRTVS